MARIDPKAKEEQVESDLLRLKGSWVREKNDFGLWQWKRVLRTKEAVEQDECVRRHEGGEFGFKVGGSLSSGGELYRYVCVVFGHRSNINEQLSSWSLRVGARR